MKGGFLAFRCGNFDNTAEREQFRFLCNKLKEKYSASKDICLLIANYNIFDSELDAILVKNDAIMALEFKNYGGEIIANENGDWTSNGIVIKGGSRKNPYQQARINHVSLKRGLKELGIKTEWIMMCPSLIIFNQPSNINNRLSSRVRSWLHVTDNDHFIEKVEDITCASTNMENKDIVDLAIKLNLRDFFEKELSSTGLFEEALSEESEQLPHVEEKNQSEPSETAVQKFDLQAYDRKTPNHIFELRQNQIFVFGTDIKGSQKFGAAGLAARKFGAAIGVVEGKTGMCYALPTKGFSFERFSDAVSRFIQFVKQNEQFTYLVTAVGCGHAGFDPHNVAELFKDLLPFENVMLPEIFLNCYSESTHPIIHDEKISDSVSSTQQEGGAFNNFHPSLHALVKYLLAKGVVFNQSGHFYLYDNNHVAIAEAELGIEAEKIVFKPMNSQSAVTFKNYGYKILTPTDYLNKSKL